MENIQSTDLLISGNYEKFAIDIVKLFFSINKRIPHIYEIYNVNVKKFAKEFSKKFAKNIKNSWEYTYQSLNPDISEDEKLKTDYRWILDNNVIIENNNYDRCVHIVTDMNKEQINGLIKFIEQFPEEKKKKVDTQIGIIIQTVGGLSVKYTTIKENKLNYDNYNADFENVDKYIKEKLDEDRQGIYLLYGNPGTGKTSYIRHLAGYSEKKLIVVPSHFTGALDSPDFISLLFSYPKSVLIIEDAERILVNREQYANSPINSLLNLSDGLIGQAVDLQVICTFNSKLTDVDRALLRKGRLIKQYEFQNLSIDRAQKLSDKLGNQLKVTEPMSLADIYNFQDDNGTKKKEKHKIGFKQVVE